MASLRDGGAQAPCDEGPLSCQIRPDFASSIGGEDRSRIRTNPSVFARLRSFAFNILKANQTDTLSQDRYRAGLACIKNLLSLLVI